MGGGVLLAAGPDLVSDGDGQTQTQGGSGDGGGPRRYPPKKLIGPAYTVGAQLGLAVWGQDEAGPYQTAPYGGASWAPEGVPARQPHEYIREGTAKLLTLFHPASGQVRVKGVRSSTNVVRHSWLQQELAAIVAALPAPHGCLSGAACRAAWETWQEGLSVRLTLPLELPPLRVLLVLDNLAVSEGDSPRRGHKTPALVVWLLAHGIMPLYTPLGGSWLNMTESVQRILVRRALDGQEPQVPQDIIDWLEATARGWNGASTPFAWGGKRQLRRQRAGERRYRLDGSVAYAQRPIRRRYRAATNSLNGYVRAN